MDELITTLTNATPEQYFFALVALFGVIWLLSVLGFQPKPVYRLYYKRPRFPRLWNTAAWLFIGALSLSVYEFSSTGQVRWIENGLTRLSSAVESLPEAEKTLSSSLNNAKETLESAFDKAEQATAEALQPPTATIEASLIPADADQHSLKRIIDGDTVELTDGTRIRLHGIDTPERDQPYGRQATRQLDRLLSRTVYVEEKDTDRYGRVVAVLWSADGTNANAAMVCGGHAWWYKRYARFDSELRDCQKYAQVENLGLWAAAEPVAPWDWRKR